MIYEPQLEKQQLIDEVQRYRERVILGITILPPSLCPTDCHRYTTRGKISDEDPRIEWNEKMLQDPGIPLEVLVNLKTILQNRAEALRKTY